MGEQASLPGEYSFPGKHQGQDWRNYYNDSFPPAICHFLRYLMVARFREGNVHTVAGYQWIRGFFEELRLKIYEFLVDIDLDNDTTNCNVDPEWTKLNLANLKKAARALKESFEMVPCGEPENLFGLYAHIGWSLHPQASNSVQGAAGAPQQPQVMDISGDEPEYPQFQMDNLALDFDFPADLLSLDPNSTTPSADNLKADIDKLNADHYKLCKCWKHIRGSLQNWQTGRGTEPAEIEQIEIAFQIAYKKTEECQKQVELLWRRLESKKRIALATPLVKTSLLKLKGEFLGIHREIIRNALAVVKPPRRLVGRDDQSRRVLRIGTNFEAEIWCLLDRRLDSISVNSVKTLVLNADQMRQLCTFSSAQCAEIHKYVPFKTNCNIFSSISGHLGRKGNKSKGCRLKSSNPITLNVMTTDSSECSAPTKITLEQAPYLNANEADWAPGPRLIAKFEKVKIAESSAMKNTGKGRNSSAQTSEGPVTSQKVFVVFYTEVTEIVNKSLQQWWIWTTSATSNRITSTGGEQESEAIADIIWCDASNALDPNSRYSTRSSAALPWSAVAGSMNDWFHEMTGTMLNPDQLNYIRSKLPLRNKPSPVHQIGLDQFCKLQPSKGFTFWKWFHDFTMLISKSFISDDSDTKEGPWQHGRVMLVSSEVAIQILKNKIRGSFLIRPSDTVSGAVTIFFVDKYDQVNFVWPQSSSNFQHYSISYLVMKCKEFKFLVPQNLSKEAAFGHYLAEEKKDLKSLAGHYYRNIVMTFNIQYENPQPAPHAKKGQQHGSQVSLEQLDALRNLEHISASKMDWHTGYDLADPSGQWENCGTIPPTSGNKNCAFRQDLSVAEPCQLHLQTNMLGSTRIVDGNAPDSDYATFASLADVGTLEAETSLVQFNQEAELSELWFCESADTMGQAASNCNNHTSMY